MAGLAIGKITEYFCSDKYKPVHKIADAADTGAATVIIEGIGTGMLSTIAPIVLVALAIIGAYTFGNLAFPLASAEGGIAVGLFGVGLAATGMLSNTAITIGVDAYGPVADNAGGIAEMAGLPEEVRDRTDALDAVGNTTAAIAKGFEMCIRDRAWPARYSRAARSPPWSSRRWPSSACASAPTGGGR